MEQAKSTWLIFSFYWRIWSKLETPKKHFCIIDASVNIFRLPIVPIRQQQTASTGRQNSKFKWSANGSHLFYGNESHCCTCHTTCNEPPRKFQAHWARIKLQLQVNFGAVFGMPK
jgi:hypothetical protein